MELELNGAPYVLDAARLEAATLHALVDALGLAGQALALAVNRRVVPRERWPETVLAPRDRVDVVRAIGGG
ncbi:thiamine biosynthesis protein ThiS [Massilia sp. WF1]|uniref:sulfur carrier protein ThiS n=1 Tax=unclassified Massilia TaxID=2609279 RepID=UPI00064A47FE|nr:MULTISPECIES: sulfur carrier protein ThiS [unclassified Massilia]ALK99331.1 thiamine biosynthesis protein ThiS [Massilia sp. WG5]KLU34995.1 thiamine biosynthesis protein ThiS [Massilia sp. WF1]